MREQPSFNEENAIEFPESRKLTKTRLFRYLEEKGIEYTMEGEGNNFSIFIDIPPEHFEDVERQKKKLGVIEPTEFDKEVILPLVREIDYSTNLRCDIKHTPDRKKYKISIFKK